MFLCFSLYFSTKHPAPISTSGSSCTSGLEDVEKGFGEEEIEYWRRKMQEKTAEVDRLGHEQKRLKALLLRSGSTDVAEYLSTRGCGMLDETIGWFATSLFKSAFIRRAFCLHLFVLYTWIIFLLWWISTRTHA
ncbi:unnamed protein product [Durusdinium trenchii]|uniref:Uncharacterized protein n=1 Tax=Durusdinium trenchii TaxID=1381693 RepID=A0ABP0RK50_9DINO